MLAFPGSATDRRDPAHQQRTAAFGKRRCFRLHAERAGNEGDCKFESPRRPRRGLVLFRQPAVGLSISSVRPRRACVGAGARNDEAFSRCALLRLHRGERVGVRGTEFEIRTPNLLTRSPALSIAKNALCAVKWKVRPKLRFSSW